MKTPIKPTILANGEFQKSTYTTMSIPEQLQEMDWREYPNQFEPHARCFYKRYETPTRCACNDDKSGIQICIQVSKYNGNKSCEINLHGELPDGSWVQVINHGMETGLDAVLATIPRLLATWECAANHK